MENQFYVLGSGLSEPEAGKHVHDLRVENYDVAYVQVYSRDEEEDCPPMFAVELRNAVGDEYKYRSRNYEKIHFSKFCKTLRWMVSAGCPYIPLEDIYQFCRENETFQTEDLEMFAIKVFEKYTTVKTVEGEKDESSIS